MHPIGRGSFFVSHDEDRLLGNDISINSLDTETSLRKDSGSKSVKRTVHNKAARLSRPGWTFVCKLDCSTWQIKFKLTTNEKSKNSNNSNNSKILGLRQKTKIIGWILTKANWNILLIAIITIILWFKWIVVTQHVDAKYKR